MTRAYAPCLAPNDTADGMPACNPAVTSACWTVYQGGNVYLTSEVDRQLISADVQSVTGPPICTSDAYFLDVVYRISADSLDCASGRCTYEDRVVRYAFKRRSSGSHYNFVIDRELLNATLPTEVRQPSYHIVSVTVIAPDGLPMMRSGTYDDFGSVVSNLTVPYDACTSPEPGGACSVPPWTAACDYESGEIGWRRRFGNPGALTVHATLRDVTGSSPLCTTGNYQVEMTVRRTSTCSGGLCTLVDQTVSVPIAADGHGLDGEAPVNFNGSQVVELVSSRLLDPTGQPIAETGVTDVLDLVNPRVSIKPDRVRIQATFPRPFLAIALDPTLGDGVTVDVTDRNGGVFSVTIPPERWQIQPPIGNRWDYKDEGGVLNGVRKARLKRILKKQQLTGYKLQLEARDIDLSAADFPGVTLTITIPGIPSGVFQAQSHRTCRGTAPKMECR